MPIESMILSKKTLSKLNQMNKLTHSIRMISEGEYEIDYINRENTVVYLFILSLVHETSGLWIIQKYIPQDILHLVRKTK
jgi:hypothetical protein